MPCGADLQAQTPPQPDCRHVLSLNLGADLSNVPLTLGDIADLRDAGAQRINPPLPPGCSVGIRLTPSQIYLATLCSGGGQPMANPIPLRKPRRAVPARTAWRSSPSRRPAPVIQRRAHR